MSQRVLVPMDHSAPAASALAFAFQTFPEADILVLHVTNPIEDTYFVGEEEFYSRYDVLEEESRDQAMGILNEARTIAQEAGRDIDTELAIGQPAQAIIGYIEEQEISSVVIGSHGRSGVARLLLGSVAEKVVRRAPVPVTVVKESPGD